MSMVMEISFEEYANDYLLVFDLTSTHEALHDYSHPELTGASIAISLRFDTGTNYRSNFIGRTRLNNLHQ